MMSWQHDLEVPKHSVFVKGKDLGYFNGLQWQGNDGENPNL